MKLATSRKHDGAITVRGENFEVVVYPAGYVRITGAATFERVLEQFEATTFIRRRRISMRRRQGRSHPRKSGGVNEKTKSEPVMEQNRNLDATSRSRNVGRPDAHVLARFAIRCALARPRKMGQNRDQLTGELEPLAQ